MRALALALALTSICGLTITFLLALGDPEHGVAARPADAVLSAASLILVVAALAWVGLP